MAPGRTSSDQQKSSEVKYEKEKVKNEEGAKQW
jgi:hypothetical protein